PRRRPALPRLINQFLHGRLPREACPIPRERLLPILLLEIASGLDKGAVFPIGHFATVYEVVWDVQLVDSCEIDRRDFAAIPVSDHTHHSRRNFIGQIQLYLGRRFCGGEGALNRPVPCFGDAESQQPSWQPYSLQRGLSEPTPILLGGVVCAKRN